MNVFLQVLSRPCDDVTFHRDCNASFSFRSVQLYKIRLKSTNLAHLSKIEVIVVISRDVVNSLTYVYLQ